MSSMGSKGPQRAAGAGKSGSSGKRSGSGGYGAGGSRGKFGSGAGRSGSGAGRAGGAGKPSFGRSGAGKSGAGKAGYGRSSGSPRAGGAGAGRAGAGGYERKPRAGAGGEGGYERKPRAGAGASGGYERKPRAGAGGEGGYERKPRAGAGASGGYERKPRAGAGGEGGYERKPRAGASGGYERKPRAGAGGEGGYERRPRTGSSSGGEGGYERRPRTGSSSGGEGGYERRPRTGSSSGGEGGYERRPRTGARSGGEGGYERRPRTGSGSGGEGGYERKPRAGAGEGGYERRPRTSSSASAFSRRPREESEPPTGDPEVDEARARREAERKAVRIARQVNDYLDQIPPERVRTARYGGHQELPPAEVDEEEVEQEFVYGRNAVISFLIEGKVPVNKIYMASGLESDKRLDRIKGLAKDNNIPLSTVEKRKLSDLIGDRDKHQGVVAQIAASDYLELSDFLDQFDKEKAELEAQGKTLDGYAVAILDGIEDPHNIGAIVRSAEASGIKAVILPQRRSAGLTRTVAKVSAGALASMRMVRISNLVSTLEKLKERGFWVGGLALEGATDIFTSDLKRPLALVIGAEGDGISRLVAEHCDFLLKIPMLGAVQSLNASVAAGVLFYEVVRQNR